MHIKSYFLGHLFKNAKKSYPALLIIIFIGLIPLYGLLYWGWSGMDAVYLYFCETLILCFITILKMRKATKVLAFARWQRLLFRKANKMVEDTTKVKMPKKIRGLGIIKLLIIISFIVINIPITLLQMMGILAIAGHGFSFGSLVNYEGGATDLLVMKANTFQLLILVLILEHLYFYFTKYRKQQEYLNTGVLNEAISFEIRIIIQQIVMIGGLALIFMYDFSKAMAIFLIVSKVLMDVIAYLRNRYWTDFAKGLEEKWNVEQERRK